MSRPGEVLRRSALAAAPDQVWRHATSVAGVNHELGPVLRMTAPAGVSLEAATLGTPLFRSWVLLFGLLPVDYDDLTLVELEPGRRFLERSQMLTSSLWEHERVVIPVPGGCVVEDRVRFRPRVRLTGPVLRVVVAALFSHRHRRLRARFGVLPGPPAARPGG